GFEWDGTPRLEEALPGVVPTDYTRLVARKCLVAAVARVFDPGCKWDHTLIIYGEEGLGKTHWISRMSKGYTAPLGDIRSKDTLLSMQRSWIDRKSTRLNSSHVSSSYAVFCLKKTNIRHC